MAMSIRIREELESHLILFLLDRTKAGLAAARARRKVVGCQTKTNPTKKKAPIRAVQ